MSDSPNKILLVVSGSVAAIKTLELIAKLQAVGCSVQVVLTESAQKYGFVTRDAVEQAVGMPALSTEDFNEGGVGHAALADADKIVVNPAAAGFIAQIVYQTTAIGRALYDAWQPKLLTPAMNVCMWKHPAVQRNVRQLVLGGWQILGPVEGHMACGEWGYGRMLDTTRISGAVSGIGQDTPEIKELYQQALLPVVHLPQAIPLIDGQRKLLLIVQASTDIKELVALVQALQERGCAVTCALSQEAVVDTAIKELEAVTDAPVYTRHYQSDANGMEHINLSRTHDAVLIYGTNKRYAEEMARGAATSFVSDIYLATDKPVVAALAMSDAPQQSHLTLIEQDGAKLLNTHTCAKGAQAVAEAVMHYLQSLSQGQAHG